MTYTISQLQSEELLLEHAKSSYNITLLGKYEWVLILVFILIGVGTLLFAPEHRTYAIVPLAIGIIELIKYPKRLERWVAKKKTEKNLTKKFYLNSLNRLYPSLMKGLPNSTVIRICDLAGYQIRAYYSKFRMKNTTTFRFDLSAPMWLQTK
jgi:hypothetical protein